MAAFLQECENAVFKIKTGVIAGNRNFHGFTCSLVKDVITPMGGKLFEKRAFRR
jgi:hypothetical protein